MGLIWIFQLTCLREAFLYMAAGIFRNVQTTDEPQRQTNVIRLESDHLSSYKHLVLIKMGSMWNDYSIESG